MSKSTRRPSSRAEFFRKGAIPATTFTLAVEITAIVNRES